MSDDKLIKELRRLDPVKPGSLDGAAEGDAAAQLMARILAADPRGGGPAAAADASRRGAWSRAAARLVAADAGEDRRGRRRGGRGRGRRPG